MEQNINLNRKGATRRLLLNYGNTDVLFGVEIGSLQSFFSFESRSLGQAEVLQEHIETSDRKWRYGAEVFLPGAHFRVDDVAEMSSNEGTRKITLLALEDSCLMDCVLRFVLRKRDISRAVIGSKEIRHRAKNLYHQYPCAGVELELCQGGSLAFECEPVVVPHGMSPLVYLRDESRDWILHFRVLATTPQVYTFKGCHRLFNRPFPEPFQRLATRSTFIRDKLLYVRERVSQRIPFQVNGATLLNKGRSIEFDVSWRWRE